MCEYLPEPNIAYRDGSIGTLGTALNEDKSFTKTSSASKKGTCLPQSSFRS